MKNAIHMLQSVTDTICNSFLITTEDGFVIAIDGGYEKETDHFLDYLKKLTGQERPRIDAWFLTHPHDDHCNNFFEIVEHRPALRPLHGERQQHAIRGVFGGVVRLAGDAHPIARFRCRGGMATTDPFAVR